MHAAIHMALMSRLLDMQAGASSQPLGMCVQPGCTCSGSAVQLHVHMAQAGSPVLLNHGDQAAGVGAHMALISGLLRMAACWAGSVGAALPGTAVASSVVAASSAFRRRLLPPCRQQQRLHQRWQACLLVMSSVMAASSTSTK